MEKGNAVKNLIKKNQLMITALTIMIAIAGYLQFAGTNLEKEYLASDNTEDLSAVDSTDIVTDMESLDSDVEIVMEDYLDEDMQVPSALQTTRYFPPSLLRFPESRKNIAAGSLP